GFVIEGPLSRDATSPNERRAMQVLIENGASYIEISNNEIRYNDYHAGLMMYATTSHIHVIGNYIHDNGRFNLANDPLTGTPTTQVDHGIYWSNGSQGNLLANN